MGYVVDRWHKSRPSAEDVPCGEHKGKYPSSAHGKGKRWQARYDGPDGRERTSLWRTQAEAEQEIRKQESAKLTGSWVDPARGKTRMDQLIFDIWLPATNTIERTKHEYRGVMNRYVVPEWEGREVRSIRPSEAGAWQNLLTTKYELSGSTPNRVSRLLRSVFHLAVLDRMIVHSPFDGVKAPTLVEAQVDPPDISQVIQLIAHAHREVFRVMIELGALTGLRSGEVRGLRLDKVDFLRRELHVHQQLVYEVGKGMFFDKLKTGAGRRTLPLTQQAVDLLAAYVAACPPPSTGDWAGLLFTIPGGRPIGEAVLDHHFKVICKRADLRPYRWHELRHHYASVLIGGGENPKVVQKRLGHKDVVTTLRIYAHLFAEAESRTRSVLDDAWQRAAAGISQATGTLAESDATTGSLALVRG